MLCPTDRRPSSAKFYKWRSPMAQDVFSKMAEDSWLLKEDGYLNADTDVKKITYHPSLNVIIICSKSGIVKVLDVNSGVVLHSSDLSGTKQLFLFLCRTDVDDYGDSPLQLKTRRT